MAKTKPNQKIHIDKLQATLTKLEQLEEKRTEELTLRSSIHFLRDKLKSALKKGYSYQDLSEILEQQGILISAATLKQYLTESNKQAAKGKRLASSGQAKGTSPKATAQAAVEGAEESVSESKEESQESLSAVESKENQKVSTASDTARKQADDVNLSQDSSQAESGESQRRTRKPARGKPKILSSSDTDLSSEFNQY